MTRDEVLDRLRSARADFEAWIAAIPEERFVEPVPGGAHSPKAILAHVAAYEELIARRLRASRRGETTSFDRDRVGWAEFNERVWVEADAADPAEVRRHADEVFGALLEEVGRLRDAELTEAVGATASLDPAWLEGRAPWELIGIDAFDHYAMHREALEAAARGIPT